jgi:hypothetical protein
LKTGWIEMRDLILPLHFSVSDFRISALPKNSSATAAAATTPACCGRNIDF